MAMTDFAIIRRSMSVRLFSTVTTVLTVAIAVALMLVLLSMREAARSAFERGSGNMHYVISAEPDPLTAVLNNVFYARAPRQYIPWPRFEALTRSMPIKLDPGRRDPSLQDGFAIPTQHGDSYRGSPVMATTTEFFSAFVPVAGRPWAFAQGRAFAADFEVVAGSEAARQTGVRLGDEIILTHGTGDSRTGPVGHQHDEFTYRVVGILEPTGTAHDHALFTSLRSAWLIHAQDRLELEHARGEHHDHDHDHDHEHIATVDDLTDEDRKITGAYIRLITRAGSDTSAALQQVFNRLRAEPGITVAQPADEIRRLFRIVSNVDRILVAMAGVVMVSSGIAVMLALYNSMEQRRRQIAILRVLGCSRPRVFGLVITESALLGLLGAAAGIILAVVGGLLVSTIIEARLGLVIEPGLSPRWTVGITAVTVALASLAGVIPAIMAYRTSVSKNLRPLG